MARTELPSALVLLLILVVAFSATPVVLCDTGQCWNDLNPTAYLNPPANPNLEAVYMFPGSPSEGWAVGDFAAATNLTTGLPSIFHFDGFRWGLISAPKFQDFPSTQGGYDLTSVNFGPPGQPISKSDGWAVGFNTTASAVAIHWDGVTWRVQIAGLSGANAGPLNAVFMVGSTDVWAVGSNTAGTIGTIWHWTGMPGLGGGWNLFTTVPHVLHSIFMVSPTDGWAVGDSGTIYHYFAGGWNAVQSPVLVTLNSVFMVSPTEGWASGASGTIINYATGIWSGPVSPGTTSQQLFSLFMISSIEGWAVGFAATILHYSGGTWTALPTNLVPVSPVTQFQFTSLFFTTAMAGWVVGTAGVIIRFDGTSWGAVTSPTMNNFTSISFGPPFMKGVNPKDGWAVGNTSTVSAGTIEPTIFHWNGMVWTKGIATGTTNNLNSVFMVSSGDVWAVGGGRRSTASCTGSALCPVILHYTGGSWNTVTPPAGSYLLKSIFMTGSTEGWAVGEQTSGIGPTGTILRYSVTGGVGAWSIFPAPSSPTPLPPLSSIFMLNPTEGWAVGDNSTILHYTVNGGVGAWNVATVSGTPTLSRDANLTSIFMLSPTNGWAVGGIQASGSYTAGPVLIHWDGTKWTPVAPPTIPGGISPTGHTSAMLKTVYCTEPNNCWAAGYPGKLFATLFHWDGLAWTHVSTTPALLGQVPPIITSIYLLDHGGWMVGSDPEFKTAIGGPTTALSTILRCTFGNAESSVTITIKSMVTPPVTSVQGHTSSTISHATNTTTTTTSFGSTIPVMIGIIITFVALLIILALALASKRRTSTQGSYPIQRRY